MVHARGLQRRHEAGGTEFGELLVVDVEVLVAPADLLTGQRLALAVFFLRLADRLDRDDAVHHATVVIHAADPGLVFHVAQALAVDDLLDVLDHRIVGTGDVEAGGSEALGGGSGRDGVLLGAGPPHAEHLGAREAGLRCRLERGRVHHAPAPQNDPVRTDLADLQPLRLLLVTRVGNGDLLDRESLVCRHAVEHRMRLLAVGRIVVEQDDLLALQVAFLRLDVLDHRRRLRPVGGDQRKHPRKHPAIGGVGPAVADRHQRDLVVGDLVQHRVGDAGR